MLDINNKKEMFSGPGTESNFGNMVFGFLRQKSGGSYFQNKKTSQQKQNNMSSGLGGGSFGNNLLKMLKNKGTGQPFHPKYPTLSHSISPANSSQALSSMSKEYQMMVKNGVTRPYRNNNPLNIKESAYTRQYKGVSGRDPLPVSDGGHFLIFDSVQSGLNAAARLLSTEGYMSRTVDQAMKRWSNSGYGGEILPSLKNKPMAALTKGEMNLLVRRMAQHEGFNIGL